MITTNYSRQNFLETIRSFTDVFANERGSFEGTGLLAFSSSHVTISLFHCTLYRTSYFEADAHSSPRNISQPGSLWAECVTVRESIFHMAISDEKKRGRRRWKWKRVKRTSLKRNKTDMCVPVCAMNRMEWIDEKRRKKWRIQWEMFMVC